MTSGKISYNVRELSQATGLSIQQIRRLRQKGILTGYRVSGQKYLFRADEVEAALFSSIEKSIQNVENQG